MQYLDFDLEIEPGRDGFYPITARLPAGAVIGVLRFPFEQHALEIYLSKLESALLRSRVGRRQMLQPQEQAIREFGTGLFESLFAGEVLTAYDQQRAQAKQQGMGVRLRLLVEAPDLATLPWEYLLDRREADFLCLSPQTPLVRYVKLPQPLEPLTVQPPLRILGMVASPRDQDPLDVAGEQERLSTALAPLEAQGKVHLHWVQGQTWEALQEELWRGPWHVFHFIGHGGFDAKADEGMLALADRQGKTELLPGSRLGRFLANGGLRLVMLNACEGARGSSRDLFSSAGAALVRREIPAVIAMQAEISDGAALQLTSTFYKAMASGMPVDAALAEARVAIWTRIPNTLEFGTPVLYLRAPDGVLFTLSSSPPVGSVQVPEKSDRTTKAKPASGERSAPPIQQVEAGSTTSTSAPSLGTLLNTYKGHTKQINALAWSPDGYYLASAGDDGVIRLWEVARGKLWKALHFSLIGKLLGANPKLNALAWSSDGSHLASVGDDATIRLWEVAHGKLVQTIKNPYSSSSPMKDVAWSPDGVYLATAGAFAYVWDRHNIDRPSGLLYDKIAGAYAVAWSPDGDFVAVAGDREYGTQLWRETSTDRDWISQSIGTHNRDVLALAWAPDSSHLASASADNTICLWDIKRICEEMSNVYSSLVYRFTESALRAATESVPHIICKGHKTEVRAVVWSPDGLRLASAGDKTVRIWDAASGKCLFIYQGHSSSVFGVAWSPDGSRLASAGEEGKVQVWSAE